MLCTTEAKADWAALRNPFIRASPAQAFRHLPVGLSLPTSFLFPIRGALPALTHATLALSSQFNRDQNRSGPVNRPIVFAALILNGGKLAHPALVWLVVANS